MQDLKRLIARYSSRLKRGAGEPDFFYLLRLIENSRPNLPKIGNAKGPEGEAVRLGQLPYLRFPETSIASIEENHLHASEELAVLVYFFGLLGVNGPMPLETTSYVCKRTYHDYDSATRRFLDIINHRMLTLFYRAFSNKELAVSFDRKDSQFERILMALTCSTPRKNSSLPHFAIKSMETFLSLRNRSADGLRRMLHLFFGHGISLNTFVEDTEVIPKEYRLRLGSKDNCTLGVNSQLGSHYLSRTKKFAITVGPMSFDRSLDFMPGHRLIEQLHEIVQLYLERQLGFDLYLKIEVPSIKKPKLNGKFALGQSCHLISDHTYRQITTIKIDISSY
ncbi:MAG: type VI secretion system baseplate subunit TssG [Succinivibrio sp.]